MVIIALLFKQHKHFYRIDTPLEHPAFLLIRHTGPVAFFFEFLDPRALLQLAVLVVSQREGCRAVVKISISLTRTLAHAHRIGSSISPEYGSSPNFFWSWRSSALRPFTTCE